MSSTARVRLWGRDIAAVTLDDGAAFARFEFDPEFAQSGIQISPLAMPLATSVYSFPELDPKTFHGLPGLLADSLPDRFGSALIDAWLATQGRPASSLNAIERLCYVGTRGMGALEFQPSLLREEKRASRIAVDRLVELASQVLAQRGELRGSFAGDASAAALQEILRVGTSAGGARPKAIVAWNPATEEIRSGQVAAGPGFEHWLLKLDGVSGSGDHGLADPQGYGAIEFAYSQLARRAGIAMTETRLLEEHGRRHFMTRRFDRGPAGEKIHMQSLGALAHLDFNLPGAHSYEQALATIRQLGLPMSAIEEQFRRMVFNLVFRNQDDHVKNIAFLMDKRGLWSLSPAFDVNYSYNPAGDWTSLHQMSVAGKRDNFTRADLDACARSAMMKRGGAADILTEVVAAASHWPEFASAAGVASERAAQIGRQFRLELPA
ncbi:MAG: HipA domain-containing protein [Thermoanaerobaculia bacterium]